MKPRNTSVRNGSNFEADIVAATRSVYLHKNEPRFRMVNGKWTPDAKGDRPPDFSACVGGRSILFDAKSTEEETWPVSLLKAHQSVALDRHLSAGGMSAVFLRLRSRGDAVHRWLPWALVSPVFWAWWDAPGSSAGRFGVGDGVAVVGCDWVGVLK
jgi:hypothetical protein